MLGFQLVPVTNRTNILLTNIYNNINYDKLINYASGQKSMAIHLQGRL
jgi:hypothetical protein